VSSLLAGFGRFVSDLYRAQQRDQVVLHAGSLAYTTLLSLVPLLTVALVTVGRVQPERAELVVRAMATMIPFSPVRVQATLTMFAERTASLGWLAIVISVIVTIYALYQIEEVINTVWGLPHRRHWQWRVASLTAVLFWGPLLLTALFSILYWLSAQPWYATVAPVARPLPALFAIAVLAGIYRWAPHTRVPWRAALAGASVATTLLIVLHLTFQAYLDIASDLNVIYGSLSLLLFFLMSLFFFWTAILLGVEASWVVGALYAGAGNGGTAGIVALLAELQREGSITTARAEQWLGSSSHVVLSLLAAPPAIIVRQHHHWVLARETKPATLEEICQRLKLDVEGGRHAAASAQDAAVGDQQPAAPPRTSNGAGGS